MKFIFKAGLSFLAAAYLCGGFGSEVWAQGSPLAGSSSQETEALAVKGKGFKVTQKELDEVYIRYSMGLAASGRSVPSSEVKKVEEEMLEQLILRKMFLLKADAEDLKLGKEKAKEEKERLLKRAGDESRLRRQVLLEGWPSYEDYLKNMEEVCICSVYMERHIKVEVKPEEVQEFYDSNKKLFDAEEMFMGGFIFFSRSDTLSGKELNDGEWASKKEQAADVLKKAKGGESFEELMKKYSDDARTRSRGLTTVFLKGQLEAAFDQAAFALRDGQMSNLIETTEGIYLVKVVKHNDAGLIPLKDVEKKIEEQLKAEKRREKLPEFSKELKKEFEVELVRTF